VAAGAAVTRVAALAIVLAALAAPRAEACSCAESVFILAPRADQTDVPLNAVVVVESMQGPFAEIPVALRAEAGEPVAVTIALEDRPSTPGRTLIVRPATVLEARTTYVIEVGTVSPLISRFTTGTARDDVPPDVLGLTSFTAETQVYPFADETGRQCVSSCVSSGTGHVDRVRFDYLPTAELAWVRLELRRASEPEPFDHVTLDPSASFLQSFSCEPRAPVFEPEGDVCARLVAFDSAGNAAGGDVELCGETVTCRPIAECEPGSNCDPIHESPFAPRRDGCAVTPSRAPTVPWLLLALALLAVRRRGGRRG
jgi:MYXO-CTERM domain-containing protein